MIHPDVLLDQLTSRQISEWEAYDRIDPIGASRDDLRFGSLQALMWNIVSHLYTKKGHTPKTMTAVDFMPDWTGDLKELKVQSVEEMKQTLLAIARQQNKKVRKTRTTPPVKKQKK